jgi:phosphatidylserine/phosphatidylglycerophosphate/cardiolipin synthase-like enzyme
VNKASVIRRSVAGVGLGLAGVYAYNVARYRRAADEGFDLPHPLAVGSDEFAGQIEVLTRATRRVGNRVRVLRNGCEIFPAMLEAIGAARECIDFSTYIYWSGDIAPRFADALATRAAEGQRASRCAGLCPDGPRSHRADAQRWGEGCLVPPAPLVQRSEA